MNKTPQNPNEARAFLKTWVSSFGEGAKKLNMQETKFKKSQALLSTKDAQIAELKKLIKAANQEKRTSPTNVKKQRKPNGKWKREFEQAKKKRQEETLARSKNYESALFEQLKLEQKAADYKRKNEQMRKEISDLKRKIDIEKLKAKIGDVAPE